MSIQLQTRVSALEAEVRLLKEKLEEVASKSMSLPDIEAFQDLQKKGPNLCPKCGEKPGYFFHVKNCKGTK